MSKGVRRMGSGVDGVSELSDDVSIPDEIDWKIEIDKLHQKTR